MSSSASTSLTSSPPALQLFLQARGSYSTCQLDVLFYLLRHLRSDPPVTGAHELFTKDLEAVSQRRWSFQQLRTATGELGARLFETESDHAYQQEWLFQRVEFVKGRGCLRVYLTPTMQANLLALKTACSPIQLHAALKLTSKHAWQLYQLLTPWPPQPRTLVYSLAELKTLLHLKDPRGREPEQLQSISQFKARVLEVAVRQLSAHTDWQLTYELVKQGRAFQAVRFTATPQPCPEPPIDFRQAAGK